MERMRRSLLLVLPLLAVALTGCSPSYSPDTYAGGAVQQANKVEQGIVVGARRVGVEASGATGAVTGGAAGGIAGSQAPVGTALTTLGGTLVGGLIGAGVEKAAGNTTAFEYIVRKPNGELLSVTQRDAVRLAVGQRVLVIAGSQARIVPDYTIYTEASPRAAIESRPAAAEPGKTDAASAEAILDPRSIPSAAP